jgi:hypothetical protein
MYSKTWSCTRLKDLPPVTIGSPVTEPANAYDIIHSHYFISWPPVYPESLPKIPFIAMLYVKVQPPYVGRLKELYSFCVVLYMDWIPIHECNYCFPLNLQPFSASTDNRLKSLSGTYPLVYLKTVPVDRVMYCTVFCLHHLYLHSEMYTCTSDNARFEFCSVRWFLFCDI